jgi:catechol 2,3-dioxygenase-like lactoylglutathione lyase family enzyme
MFDHISIGVADLARTKRFYDAALKPLGYTCLRDGADMLGYGAKDVALWIGPAKRPVPADPESGLHFCFAAPTRQSVDAFMPPRSLRAAPTTASRASAPITATTTMQLL